MTTPLRMRMHKPSAFFLDPSLIASSLDNYTDLFQDNVYSSNDDDDEGEDEDDDDSLWKPDDASSKVFPSPGAVIEDVVSNRIFLQRFGGLKVLHDGTNKIFVDGKAITLAHQACSGHGHYFYDYRTIDAIVINRLLASATKPATMLR